MAFHKTKTYNYDIQIWAMRSKYPQFKVKKKSKSEFEFIGDLQVKPEFPLYTVSITYRGSSTPLVKILSPELVSNPPHFYKQSQTLCLYHPDNYKWTKEKLVATDIVSWTAAWIYFYEVWLEKGIWYAPEATHTKTQKENE
jgi:hypothetical protein